MNVMQFSVVEQLALVFVGFCCYLLILRRLADLAQPYRLRLAEIGEQALADGMPAIESAQVRFYLDNAFNGWVTVAANFVLPFVARGSLTQLLRSRGLLGRVKMFSRQAELLTLFIVSAFAANPLFGIVALLEFFLLGMVFLLLNGPSALMSVVLAVLRVKAATSFRKWPLRSQSA
jgi:hypothetical protein